MIEKLKLLAEKKDKITTLKTAIDTAFEQVRKDFAKEWEESVITKSLLEAECIGLTYEIKKATEQAYNENKENKKPYPGCGIRVSKTKAYEYDIDEAFKWAKEREKSSFFANSFVILISSPCTPSALMAFFILPMLAFVL